MAYTDIDKPSDYFNTVLYTGNGTTGHAITGVGFQPDWLWIKERSSTSAAFIYDVIRGVNVKITPSTTDPDSTVADSMTSFDSDGFTVGNNGATNESGQTVVAWNWLAGGTASSNTDGSITSSVSANTTSGFSIVSWTGTGSAATIGHGLSSTPEMIICKNRSSSATNWQMYNHKLSSTPETSYIYFNTMGGRHSYSGFWNSTAPTSSVFSIGTDSDLNTSGENVISYCFHSVKSYSKISSYVGNGNADGTFVYTGFKPAWVMIKRIGTDGDAWLLFDNKRPGYNLIDNFLEADANGAEAVNNPNQRIDTISNGFKCRGTGTAHNASGSTYIYMAFAENPFVTSTGIPCTAR